MIPKTWFSTPLSKSAKDTEGRIRNIFEGERRRPAVLVLVFATASALLCGSMVAIRERDAKKAQETSDIYASVEGYVDAVCAGMTAVTYRTAGGEEKTANVLDTRVAFLKKEGEQRQREKLDPEGTLELYSYQIEAKLDVPLSDVALFGGMYATEDGWLDLEGQGGHVLIVARRQSGGFRALYDRPRNDDWGGLYYSGENVGEMLHDWYVKENHIDLPLYTVDLLSADEGGDCPAHRVDGDGWYVYIPVQGWYRDDDGETARWLSEYSTGSTISVRHLASESECDLAPRAEHWDWADQQERKTLTYEDAENQETLTAYLHKAQDGGYWQVLTRYAWATSLHSDRRGLESDILTAMAESFTVMSGSGVPGAGETLRELFARLAPEDVRLTYFEGGKQKKTVEGASALLAADYLAMLAGTEWADAYPIDEDTRANAWRVVLETPGWQLTYYQGWDTVLLEKNGETLWLVPRYLPDVGFGGDNTYSAPETWYRDALAAETHRRAQIEAFPNDRPLTGEELSSWRETLKSEESFLDETWGGYTARSTVVSCFFTSYYSDPCDLDLSSFLDYCPLGESIGIGDGTMTEAEHEAIVAALGGHDPSRVVPTHRYRASDVNAALMQYAGVTLDDLRVDWRSSGEVLYLSEYDAFYNFTSDWGPGLFFPRYGELRDNVLTLWSDNAAVEIVLSGGGWHIQAHMAIAGTE